MASAFWRNRQLRPLKNDDFAIMSGNCIMMLGQKECAMARPATDIDAGRAELLDLVERIFEERGAMIMTLSELATHAKMSPANIYRFFENKEALFEAIAERWFEPKIAIMDEVLASDAPIREKFFDFYARRYQLMLDQHRENPVLFESYCDLGQQHFEIIRGYIDLGDHNLSVLIGEAKAEGYFPAMSIDSALSHINLMVHVFVNPKAIILVQPTPTLAKLRNILDAIFDGLGRTADATLPIDAQPSPPHWHGLRVVE
jgi:AcrR family transcriptional regulator